MSEPAISDIELQRARLAVLEAGEIAMRYFRGRFERWEKGPGQIVTEADLAVDKFLEQRLPDPSFGDAWLSEESLDSEQRLTARRVWVVDPIDGTRSFAEGKPEFTICVGLLVESAPVAGFVLNPATSELFEAVAGRGAMLDGRPLTVEAGRSLAGARIAVSQTETRRRKFDALLPQCEVSTIGSLAYKLALVAAGRFDAYLSWRHTYDWDIAAAALILAEAGARLTDGSGSPIRLNEPIPRHQGIIAAAPDLHTALVDATRDAHASWRSSLKG